jgi:hypothetical protein
LTTVLPVIRYDAVIEAALDGTLQQAFTVDKRGCWHYPRRKTGFAPNVAATPLGRACL